MVSRKKKALEEIFLREKKTLARAKLTALDSKVRIQNLKKSRTEQPIYFNPKISQSQNISLSTV